MALALSLIILQIRCRRKQRCNLRRKWRIPWKERRQQQAMNYNLLKELEEDGVVSFDFHVAQ